MSSETPDSDTTTERKCLNDVLERLSVSDLVHLILSNSKVYDP